MAPDRCAMSGTVFVYAWNVMCYEYPSILISPISELAIRAPLAQPLRIKPLVSHECRLLTTPFGSPTHAKCLLQHNKAVVIRWIEMYAQQMSNAYNTQQLLYNWPHRPAEGKTKNLTILLDTSNKSLISATRQFLFAPFTVRNFTNYIQCCCRIKLFSARSA